MTAEILIAIATGIISSVATVAALKTDVRWIKDQIVKIETRVQFLERNI